MTTFNLSDPLKSELDRMKEEAGTTLNPVKTEIRKMNKTRLAQTIPYAFQQSPQEQANINRLANEFKLPKEIIESDTKEFEKRLKLRDLNMEKLLDTNPFLADFLTDPYKASVAQNDIDKLKALEDTLKKEDSSLFDNLDETIGLSFKGMVKGLGLRMADKNRANFENFKKMFPEGFDFSDEQSDFQKLLGIPSAKEQVKQLDLQIETTLAELNDIKEQQQDLTPADLNLLQKGTRAGIESLVMNLPSFAMMAITRGQAVPALGTLTVQSYSASYGDARAEGLSVVDADRKASIDASIELLTEIMPLTALEKIVTGKTEGLTKEAIGFMVKEMAGEQVATLGQSLNDYMFGLDEQMENAESASEMLKIQLERQAITAIATVVAGGAQMGVAQGANRLLNAQAKQIELEGKQSKEQQDIDSINASSAESELRTLDPDSFRQFIQDSDNGDQSIFMDAVQVKMYLDTQQGVDEPILNMLREKVQQASIVGADIEVPLADFATDMAGTPHFDALRDTMTMSGETTAPFRQEQQRKEQQDFLKSMMQEADESVSQYVEAQEVVDTIRDQLIDSGQMTPQTATVNAKLALAYMTRFAKANNLGIKEAFDQSGLNVSGPMTGEKARLSDEEILLDSKVFNAEVDPVKFSKAISKAKQDNKFGALVHKYSEEEYKDMRMFLSEDGSTGFAIKPDGDIVSLFKSPDSPVKGALAEAIPLAIKLGGTKLDAFDGKLTEWYTEQGFEETERFPWDDQYMPEDWDKELLGEPDVVMMRLKNNLNQTEVKTGRAFASFFSGVTSGESGTPTKSTDYEPVLPVVINSISDPESDIGIYHNEYLKHSGNFDMHIGLSIPAYREFQYLIGDAILNTFDEGTMLDIGASEGSQAKTITSLSDGKIKTLNLDPNPDMKASFDSISQVEGATYSMDALGMSDSDTGLAWTEDDGTEINYFDDKGQKFDIVQEAMVFQFIDANRDQHIKRMAELTKDDGIAIVQEKVFNENWDANEKKKNEEFKSKYFFKEDLTAKAAEVLEGMNKNMVEQKELESLLNQNFNFVEQIWDSGNFKGYVASNSQERIQAFQSNLKDTSNPFDTRVEATAGDKLKAKIESDFDGAVAEYATRPDSKDGKILNTDIARELSEDYLNDRTKSADVHESASAFIKRLYVERLKQPAQEGERDLVLFTGGGTGAGKSSAVDKFGIADDVHTVYDTNMNKYASAKLKVEQALEAGKEVQIVFVHRDPVEALVNGALPRAVRQESEFGTGRTVPLIEHLRTHEGALKTVKQLQEEYINDDRVEITVIDNSLGFNAAVKSSFDNLPAQDYNNLLQELNEALENEYQKGNISESIYKGFKSETLRQQDNRQNGQESEQQGQGVTRGYFDPVNSAIRLTEASDSSTFIHEFAHFMYENELNNRDNSPDNINTVESIHNWFRRNVEDVAKEAGEGVTPDDVNLFLDTRTTGDLTKDKALRRATHEQFARGFETYIMEGKAPSVELRNIFRSLARLLVEVYRSVRGDLNVKLDDEMRETFDALLATEEQIDMANARAQYAPLFTDATMAGMTEKQYAEYQANKDKVRDKQSETLRDAIIKQIRRKTEKWYKDELKDEVVEQTEKLKNERVYATREALKNGEIKLDHATVKDMVGEDVTNKRGVKSRRIPPVLSGMTAKGGKGIDPEQAATLFEYNSGDEMLQDLMNAVPIKDKAEAQAESIMMERHGDILNDGTIEKEADDALLNEERGLLILKELRQLNKKVSGPQIKREALKSLAEEEVAKLSYRNIHPAKYRKAEIRYAQESATLYAEGDFEGAMRAKTRQALNYYLYKASNETRNDIDKMVTRMSRYNKKSVREEIAKAENGYWEQIVKILNRFEFRKSASLKQVDKKNQAIEAWMRERIETDGDALVLTPEVLDEVYTTHWKNVPYTQLKGITDSIKNIEHVARYANKIKSGQETLDFKRTIKNWVDSIKSNSHDKSVEKFKARRIDAAEGKSLIREKIAQMTKVSFLAQWLDGGEKGGISFDLLMQPFTDAQQQEMQLWESTGTDVMNLIKNRSKEDINRHNTKVYIPEIEDSLYGNQILAVALNTGNEGNLRKMLLGEGWANPEDDTTVSLQNPKLQAVLNRMTQSDWQLVQSIWDKMDELYPMLAEVHRRTTGLTPPKVEATPVQTSFGTFKGGYYPVKYDANRSQRAAQNEEKANAEIDSMFSNGSSIHASVTASATNERTGYYAPIKLSLDVVPAHFQETIHYITHHDAVRQTNKLIQNEQVRFAISESVGPEEYKQLKPWLNAIAKDGRESTVKLLGEEVVSRVQHGVTLGSMGFAASTGLMQFLGLSNIVAEVGPKHTYRAFRQIFGGDGNVFNNLKESWTFAAENSKIMSNRVNTMDREIKNAMMRISKQIKVKTGNPVLDALYRFDNSDALNFVQQASMAHIAYIQTFTVDLPTWYAAYLKEFDASGDEQQAIKVADLTVENIQGSGSMKDMSTIMRSNNSFYKMITMFMTFFSSLWNLTRDLERGTRLKYYNKPQVAGKVLFLLMVPVALEMVLRGEFGEPEDEDDRLQNYLTKTALYPVASVPFARDIISAGVTDFSYNISPVASILGQGVDSVPEMLRRPLEGEEITRGQIKNSSKLFAALFGIPATGQIWKTADHLQEVSEGEEFTMREFLLGPDREEK